MRKTVQLTGEALDKGRELHAKVQAICDRKRELHAEFERKHRELDEELNAAVIAAWGPLLEKAGLAGENPREWVMDGRYLEGHGLIFLINESAPDEAVVTHVTH